MTARSEDYKRGARDGVRWAITWLHNRAGGMNDPHAQGVLNGAAFNLGVDLSEAGFIDRRARKMFGVDMTSDGFEPSDPIWGRDRCE